MNRRSEWMNLEEGGSIHQAVSYLRGACRNRDFERVEKLFVAREKRIRDEMAEEMKKKVAVEEMLRKEVEKGLLVKVELEEGLRKEVEELKVKCGGALRLKEVMEERLRVLEMENERLRDGEERALKMCEELRRKATEMEVRVSEVEELELKCGEVERLKRVAEEKLKECEKENMRLWDAEKRGVENFDKLNRKVMEIKDDMAKNKAKEMQMKAEVEERLRKEVELLEVKCAEAVRKKDMVEERLKQLEKECEEIRKGNSRLREEEKRAAGMCESKRITEMEEDAKERLKEVEMKVEFEVGLRKKAEEDLLVSETKLKELEEKVSSLLKDIEVLRSFEAEAQGSGMEVDNDHKAEAEGEAEVQPPVRVPSDQFAEGENRTSPVSAAKHGPGNCIEISSSSDDDLFELQSRLKRKSNLAPVKLDFESYGPSKSDPNSQEVSSGLKRKGMSSNDEDKTESIPQPPAGEKITPHSQIQEGIKKVRPNSGSVTPPPGFSTQKSVNSSQAGGSRDPKLSLDNEEYRKSLLEKLITQHWDDVSSDSSSS